MSLSRSNVERAWWVIVIAILPMVFIAGVYINMTLRSIERTLPTSLVNQLDDLSRITEGLGSVVATSAHMQKDPNLESIAGLVEQIDGVLMDLAVLRDSYVFDNLVQASAFHAAVTPSLVDARQWLNLGVSGHAPDSHLTLAIVHSRLRGTLVKATSVRSESHGAAQTILQDQRQRLDRFINGVNLLLFLAFLTSMLVLGLMLRQHKLLIREAMARAERESLIAILESASILVSKVTTDGRLIYLNQAGRKMAGWGADEPLDGKMIDNLHPDWAMRKIEGEGLPAAVALGSWEGQTSVLHRDGREISVSQVILAHRSEGGEIEFLSSIMRDITDRVRVEKERDKIKAQLIQAQKMESVGILAGGVAHDFNNFLQAMGGSVQLLLADKPDDHPDAKRLKTMARSIDRAAQLVRQLLLFSRKVEVKLQPVDLNREVEDAVLILKHTIPRMVDIELHLDDSLWPIHADPVQVEQVLFNLGGNAGDAMPDGGRLVVETCNIVLDDDFVRIHMGSKSGKHVLLAVSDTGCGMSKDTVAHIFDPFFTTKEVGRGTGLGLASVYGIVKSHDGYVYCYSELGQGTTFRIYWPALEESAPADAVSAPVVSASTDHESAAVCRGMETILVVDDEEDIRALSAEALESEGYTVLRASSGEEALAVYAELGQSIHMIILDLSMPGMGGHQCLHELLEMYPLVRVVISSGYSVNGQARDISRLAAGFIGKPYRLDDLMATVRAVLDRDDGTR